MKTFLFKGIFVVCLFLVCGCDDKQKQTASALTHGGNPDAGCREIEYYGCASCHVVPGVAGAQGLIGPSLKQVESRNYIGGVVKNSPDQLIRWIQNAPSLSPKTAMPDLEIPDQQARDIASYLYTLR
jgi:cytochrome c